MRGPGDVQRQLSSALLAWSSPSTPMACCWISTLIGLYLPMVNCGFLQIIEAMMATEFITRACIRGVDWLRYLLLVPVLGVV